MQTLSENTCIHCGQYCKLPPYAWHNVETYRKSAVVVTECCNKPITLVARTVFSFIKYNGNNDQDDWGVPIPK